MNFALCAQHAQPATIFDIGANVGNWALEARQTWPNAHVICVEGNYECEGLLKERNLPYVIALLGNKGLEPVEFYTLKDCGTAVGASYYREKTPFFFDYDKIVITKRFTTRLDHLFEGFCFSKPILLKLDTQGSELDILKGGIAFLQTVKWILIEVSYIEYNEGAPTFEEVMKFLSDQNFVVVEKIGHIVHPISREQIQSDLLFKRMGYEKDL